MKFLNEFLRIILIQGIVFSNGLFTVIFPSNITKKSMKDNDNNQHSSDKDNH